MYLLEAWAYLSLTPPITEGLRSSIRAEDGEDP
jgi:hypothetical protein